MNGDYVSVKAAGLAVAKSRGVRKSITITFQDSVVANFARRKVMYGVSRLQQLDALAGTADDHKKVDSRDDYARAIEAVRLELISRLVNAMARPSAAATGAGAPTTQAEYSLTSARHMPFLQLFEVLDSYASFERGEVQAGRLRGAEANARINEAKQLIARLVERLEELLTSAREKLGASLSAYYIARAASTSDNRDVRQIPARRLRRLEALDEHLAAQTK